MRKIKKCFFSGLIALGFVFICWALINIKQENKNLENAYINQYSSSAVHVVERLELLIENAEKIDVDEIYYTNYPAEGDIIGSLVIPKLNQDIPIVQGTSNDELEKGVGHFTQSVLPGQKDNCVFSGHRNTVFSEIGQLKVGDDLIVKTIAGTFTYQVAGTRIVDKDDKTVIVPTDNAMLTLTTCYPLNGRDLAPRERYILTASLVID